MMSYHAYFSFSQGFATPLTCPRGTFDGIMEHVRHIEGVMGIERVCFEDNPEHWNHRLPFGAALDDKAFCREASAHNEWVRDVYEKFSFWFENPFTVGKGHQDKWLNTAYPVGWASEIITPEQAKEFWPALTMIDVPVERWSADYYRERMDHLYEVMRGRDSEGVSFDAKALTEKQAAAVIKIFSEYLDVGDLRLDVPNGRDWLKSSYDGGYTWCEKCGAVDEVDVDERVEKCRKRKCPLKAEYGETANG